MGKEGCETHSSVNKDGAAAKTKAGSFLLRSLYVDVMPSPYLIDSFLVKERG